MTFFGTVQERLLHIESTARRNALLALRQLLQAEIKSYEDALDYNDILPTIRPGLERAIDLIGELLAEALEDAKPAPK